MMPYISLSKRQYIVNKYYKLIFLDVSLITSPRPWLNFLTQLPSSCVPGERQRRGEQGANGEPLRRNEERSHDPRQSMSLPGTYFINRNIYLYTDNK